MLENPFVGLRPYERDEAPIFFGRDSLTKELLERLQGMRFVAVVGSSGSGKSSLIRAGLIPELEAGFLAQDRDRFMRRAERRQPHYEEAGNQEVDASMAPDAVASEIAEAALAFGGGDA